MKKILCLFAILSLTNSCNGQEKKEVKNIVSTTKRAIIQVDKITFNKSVNDILKPFGLTKNDNHNTMYNLNLDYEEFAFSPDYDFKFGNLNIGKINSLIVYYLKGNNSAFTYELELENNDHCELLIGEFKKSFGKPSFYKKLENTKQHPVFLDENGEQETQHITEESMRWNDVKNDVTYFAIHRQNLDSRDNKLTVIAMSNTSDKFDEWFDFRSLDMVFSK